MDDSEALAGGDILPGVSVHAGFPNPAADRHGTPLKLDQLLIRHPSSTYMFRVTGYAHEEQGIFDGDIALIDRALTPQSGDLVISWSDAGFAIKRFAKSTDEPWGVITTIIHQYRKPTP